MVCAKAQGTLLRLILDLMVMEEMKTLGPQLIAKPSGCS